MENRCSEIAIYYEITKETTFCVPVLFTQMAKFNQRWPQNARRCEWVRWMRKPVFLSYKSTRLCANTIFVDVTTTQRTKLVNSFVHAYAYCTSSFYLANCYEWTHQFLITELLLCIEMKSKFAKEEIKEKMKTSIGSSNTFDDLIRFMASCDYMLAYRQQMMRKERESGGGQNTRTANTAVTHICAKFRTIGERIRFVVHTIESQNGALHSTVTSLQ